MASHTYRLSLAVVVLAGCANGTLGDAMPEAGPDGGVADVDASATPAETLEVAADAQRALQDLLLGYWRGQGQNLAAEPVHGGPATGYWIYAQALDAVVLAASLDEGERWRGWIETLYLAQKARGFGRDYVDDENWMALALVRAYRVTGESKYLDESRAIFDRVMAAWDETCCGDVPGGLWWDQSHSSKATAANAGPVITATMLAAVTGNAAYRDFAVKTYNYWRDTMVDPETGRVSDHVDPDGTVVNWAFSYNEGLWVGAATALYDATGDFAYLADAKRSASYLMATQTDDSILTDGTAQECGGDCPMFKGIAYRYLAELYAIDETSELGHWLHVNAQSIIGAARGENGLFAVDWRGSAETTFKVESHVSATLALLAHASLEKRPRAPAPLSRYEAEEAVIHGLGLEGNRGEFSGWGYVAGWNADGQWLDFRVPASSAGRYRLTLEYAAGAGETSRLIYINGGSVQDNFSFAATGSWEQPDSASLDVDLIAGVNAISVIYNGGLGSHNYLNLDAVTVEALE